MVGSLQFKYCFLLGVVSSLCPMKCGWWGSLMGCSDSGAGLGIFDGWRDRNRFLHEMDIDESSSFDSTCHDSPRDYRIFPKNLCVD